MWMLSAFASLVMIGVYAPALYFTEEREDGPSPFQRAILIISYLLSFCLIFAVGTIVAPWSCDEENRLKANPAIVCNPLEDGKYAAIVVVSIVLGGVGCCGE